MQVSRRLIAEGNNGRITRAFSGSRVWIEKEVELFNGDILRPEGIREANYLSQFEYSNLISAHSIEIKGTKVCTSMTNHKMNLTEFINSVSRERRMKSFIKIFSQVVRSVCELHSNGVVHRNLTPDNILIDIDHSVNAYVTGLCSISYEVNTTCKNVTEMQYTPPELKNRPRKYGPYNDVWTLGITMIKFIVGGTFSLNKYIVGDALRNLLSRSAPSRQNDLILQVIEMTTRVKDRVDIYTVYRLLDGPEMSPFPREYSPIQKCTLEDCIECRRRRDVITKVYRKMTNRRRSLYKTSVLHLDLGVSICDRYCEKSGENFSSRLFKICVYIATVFLYDGNLAVHDRQVRKTFLFDRFSKEVRYTITCILSTLEFDIYRPTFYSYVQSKRGNFLLMDDEDTICRIFSDVDNFDIPHDELYKLYESKVKPSPVTPIKRKIVKVPDAPKKKMEKTEQEHYDYIKMEIDYIILLSRTKNQKAVSYKNLLDYIVKHDILNLPRFKTSTIPTTIKSKLDEFEKVDIPELGEDNPAHWAPDMKRKLYSD